LAIGEKEFLSREVSTTVKPNEYVNVDVAVFPLYSIFILTSPSVWAGVMAVI
jgi:hypothetical protein